ncbi:hypothetical protein SUGI_0879840 [Cryptomeria japonica]|uniref:cytochrome P450 86A22 n=1 Tax=Cryptomeria japonica TaxID=3369 RepID=UPI002414C91F|nr:cytochrome P450 86A22 [Cryptomeria japonica]XP_057854943.1 cytochrome P450 86A22 [Cryptomeria japonica]XP_057854945.1 cytochrome P450 86A22 [Cryptomeria japonica]GLJ42452.1 hypothetical protein SUGI_0879840 [Cryptomeria japonica]
MEFSTIALVVAVVVAYMAWFKTIVGRLRGPKVWPVVGSLPGLLQNRARMHDWISDNLREVGGTYQTCICAIPFLAKKQGLVTVTCNSKNLEHILKTRFDNYPKGPQWQAAFHDLLGDGIFNSDGETWLVQRKTAALEFTTRTLRNAMARWVNRSIRGRLWPILAEAHKLHKPVDLQDLLLRLTFDNICGLAFGKDPETLALGLPVNPFANAFDNATEATLQRFIFPEVLWKLNKMMGLGMELDLRKSVALVEKYLSDIIAVRKKELSAKPQGLKEGDQQQPHDDLLSRFIRKKDGDGKAFSDSFLRNVALNFILAGRDTSSVALSWFFWLIMQNPRVEDKVIAEISEVLTQSRGTDTSKWIEEPLVFEEVDQLVYLKAALSETLRLYPSVPQDSKYVLNDDTLPDGTFVPGGSTITYSIYSVGRLESLWGPDCYEFKPERWIQNGKFELPEDAYKFVSFNGGPRICLGKDLAYLQMKSIVAGILLRHRISLVPDHPVQQKMSLTLFMKHGLKVYVEPRILST